jgi:hypothetical protein
MSTDVSEVCAASLIALMMKAASTPETSVDIQYIPDDPERHIRRRENLKSHLCDMFSIG